MKQIKLEALEKWHLSNFQNKIVGRWITLPQIVPVIKKLSPIFKYRKIGFSFLNNDIYSVKFGNGKTKILIWTQMHGNESTGTKALFDFFKFFENDHELNDLKKKILDECTFVCIPLLNPDGADVYTRVNGQGIDLNRDVIDKKAVESRILQDVLLKFRPDYCFNMHDQRTIFSVGVDNYPATISFLAPSEDVERTITKGRIQTMDVIMAMNKLLQHCIPNQVGRYTDEFYPTATGDNFQKMGYNTILIESGHFLNDYQRETTRKYTFYSLLQGVLHIANRGEVTDYKPYFDIPDNEKYFLDIIVQNVNYMGKKVDIGILFIEKLINKELHFVPRVEKVENLVNYNANRIENKPELIFESEKEMSEWVLNEYY